MEQTTPALAPIKVIKLKGEINGSRQSDIRSAFLASQSFSTVAIDLSEASSVDTSFLSALVSLKNEYPETAARIKLVNPAPEVSKILRLFHMDMAFEIIETLKSGGLS